MNRPRKARQAYSASRDNPGIASSQNRANAALAAMKKDHGQGSFGIEGKPIRDAAQLADEEPLLRSLDLVSNVRAGKVQIFGDFTVLRGDALGLFVAQNCLPKLFILEVGIGQVVKHYFAENA